MHILKGKSGLGLRKFNQSSINQLHQRPTEPTFFSHRDEVVHARRGDAQVVVGGEPSAVQHIRPWEPEGVHHRCAAVLNALTERPARLDRFVQVIETNGGEKGAEKLSGVGVALLLHQRGPRGRLLQDLVHGLVAQEVGQAHLRVFNIVAQMQILWYGLAVVLLWLKEFRLAKIV